MLWKRWVWTKFLSWTAIVVLVVPTMALAYHSPGFYISSAVGGTPLNSRESVGKVYGVFLSGGFAFRNNLRTEIEVSYWNKNTSSMSLMSNIYYTFFQDKFPLSPYVGAGIGGLWGHGKNTVFSSPIEQSFTYQGKVGLNYTMSNTLHSFLDYRYLRIKRSKSSVQLFAIHGVVLGIRWSFGLPFQDLSI